MKILVTGSAGFIGFHVARALLERGDEVVGVDNFNPYYDVQLKEDRNAILCEYKNYGFRADDIADSYCIKVRFEEKFDVVVHLAAQAGVRYSIENPHAYIDANIEGFINILEGCRHTNTKLIYASSSSVYGDNTPPFKETDRVDTPQSLYAVTKKSNEQMAYAYSHLYGLQTIGLRFFTVYGEWGRPDMAMWLFVEAILNDKPIKVFNNGDMQRDFTYIDDIVQGTISAVDTTLGQYEIFNLGNNRSENIMDVISIIEDTLGKKAVKELLPMQPGDIRETCADIELAKKKLNFMPKTKTTEGIPKFINWYKKNTYATKEIMQEI